MKAPITRRGFLQVSGAALAAAVAAGCGATPTATPTAAPKAAQPTATKPAATAVPPQPAQKVTITYATFGNILEVEIFDRMAKLFEEKNNIKLQQVQVTTGYNEKLLAMIAGGTPPEVFALAPPDYRTWVAKKRCLDITDMIKGDALLGKAGYFMEPQETNRSAVNGRWYGTGLGWVCQQGFYNEDLVAKAGVKMPTNDVSTIPSWDEMLQLARQLTLDENGRHPNDSGFAADKIKQYGYYVPVTWNCLPHPVWSNGGAYYEDWKITLDKPEAIEGIQMVADLFNVHKVAPRPSTLGDMGMNQGQMMETGRLAYMQDGFWQNLTLRGAAKKVATCVPPKIKKCATPMHAAMRCISVDTKQKDAAWKYLRFLNTVEFNKEYNSSNIVFPHLMDLVKDPASWVSKEEIAKGFDKIASQLAVQHGFSLYPPAGFGEAFNGIILPALNDVWNGKKTAKDVLTAVVPEANKITEAYAKGEK